MTSEPHDRHSTPDSERTDVFGQVPTRPAFHEQLNVNGEGAAGNGMTDNGAGASHTAGNGADGSGAAGNGGGGQLAPTDSHFGDRGRGNDHERGNQENGEFSAHNSEVDAQNTNADTELNSNDKSMFALIGLVALAVIASVVMLFTSSTTWMKIAVLAALWAAFLGALLVSRFRQQVGDERQRSAELQRIHQLEMDKEMATHREQELLLEQSYLDSLREQHADTLAELKVELQKLREHLAEMLGADLEEERVALRAEAERIRELEAKADLSQTSRPALRRAEAVGRGEVGAHTNSGPVTPEGLRQVREEKQAENGAAAVAGSAMADAAMAAEPGHPANAQADEAGFGQAGFGVVSTDQNGFGSGAVGESTSTGGGTFSTDSFAAVDWTISEPGEQVAEVEFADSYDDEDFATQAIPVHRDWAAAAGMKVPAQSKAAEQPNAEQAEAEQTKAAKGKTDNGTAAEGKADKATVEEDKADTVKVTETDARSDVPADHHGRRRADENKNALTVAELLAQMRKDK